MISLTLFKSQRLESFLYNSVSKKLEGDDLGKTREKSQIKIQFLTEIKTKIRTPMRFVPRSGYRRTWLVPR